MDNCCKRKKPVRELTRSSTLELFKSVPETSIISVEKENPPAICSKMTKRDLGLKDILSNFLHDKLCMHVSNPSFWEKIMVVVVVMCVESVEKRQSGGKGEENS